MEIVRKVLTIILFVSCMDSVFAQPEQLISWEEKLNKAIAWFEKYDLNHDDRLSLEEFPENAMKFWPMANFDGDNFLTLEEEKRFQKIEYEQLFLTYHRNIDRISGKQKYFNVYEDFQIDQPETLDGEWLCFTTMYEQNGELGTGVMYMILNHNQEMLTGELRQLATPTDDLIEFELDSSGQFVGKYKASLQGKIISAKKNPDEQKLIYLDRQNYESGFRALFTGVVSPDNNSMICQLINNIGNYGTMVVIRREAINKLR